ncbi:Hsp20/alpha crystallin family protein [Celerinatantimonas sp. YJH-8]|uniref:Hsp20/alpha crystallin family protein n=1 Tax=Celerinatantimonas sp. YJH-8 TaxID=3228714 RepID=UPI0038C3F0FF
MKLRPWNPTEEFDDLFSRVGSLMNWPSPFSGASRSWLPATDISENAGQYMLKVELPEMRKEDIQLSIEDGYLVLSGERKHEKSDEKQHLSERFYGQFTRRFQIPDNVKVDKIDAKFDSGMLYLTLPKTEQKAESRQRIDIH